MARSPRRAPASPSRGPSSTSPRAEGRTTRTRACPSAPIPMAHSVSEPSPNRVTSSSGVRTTTTCSRPSAPGWSCEGQPGGGRLYSHAYAALDLKPGMGSQEVNLVLRRGATVEGRVVGPDGQPVGDAWIFSRLILDPSQGACEVLDRPLSWQGEQRPFRDPRARPRCRGPRLLPRAGAQAGSRRQPLGQVGGGRADHRPARALRVGPGVARRSRRQAGRETGAQSEHHDGRDPRSRQQRLPERQGGQPALRRRGRPDRRRPDQLREGAGPRCRRPDRRSPS